MEFLERIVGHLSGSANRPAFHIGGTTYSYRDLEAWIAGIQRALEQEAVEKPQTGVYLADDIQTYSSILAIWLSGRTFVPINPQSPPQRNRRIQERLELPLILHSGSPDPVHFLPGSRTLPTDSCREEGARVRYIRSNEGSDAYVLFTSGSTGIPKGVRITYRNLDTFVTDFTDHPTYDFSPEDRFLQLYDLSFDASIHCYTVPLACGASVYTVPPGGIKYLAAYKLMQEHGLTFVKMPPSTLTYLKPHFPSIRLDKLRYCLLGGEAFPSALAREWEPCVPNALIQNVYGPTEATINCTIYNWNGPGAGHKEKNGVVSIGRAFGRNRVLAVDSKGRANPPGIPGELAIGGDQLSPGYWMDPGLNRKAFFTVNLDGSRERFYHSGDLAVVDRDGDVFYLGRNDEQVQVQGYRVELGEIEARARDFLKGVNVMAAGSEHEPGTTRICLFVESGRVDKEGLIRYLKENLPPFMVPSSVACVEEFPKLISGKTDRRKLKDSLKP